MNTRKATQHETAVLSDLHGDLLSRPLRQWVQVLEEYEASTGIHFKVERFTVWNGQGRTVGHHVYVMGTPQCKEITCLHKEEYMTAEGHLATRPMDGWVTWPTNVS